MWSLKRAMSCDRKFEELIMFEEGDFSISAILSVYWDHAILVFIRTKDKSFIDIV